MIPQRDLSLLSNRLAERGGRRVPESVLERDYCLSWFLVGFSRSPLRERLVFKGGTALKKCYFADYRFSEDLDFTRIGETPWEEIERGLAVAFERTYADSGIALEIDRLDRRPHENSHTFWLAYDGPLPASRTKTVKVDITLRERIASLPVDRALLRGYEEYRDLPGNAILSVYSLEEIAAEKIVALLDRARTEPRDLYDLWFLTAGGHVRLDDLVPHVSAKLEFRGGSLERSAKAFSAKEPRLRALWDVRLAPQMIELPPFDGVHREVRRALRRAGVLP